MFFNILFAVSTVLHRHRSTKIAGQALMHNLKTRYTKQFTKRIIKSIYKTEKQTDLQIDSLYQPKSKLEKGND